MRVAFLSDPHGDLVALRKVIADLESAGPVDEVLVGGDLAQGGAQPKEVVDEIRARGWRSVRGNADDLLIRIADGMAAEAALKAAEATHGALPSSVAIRARWSVERLGPDRIGFLRSLPMAIELGPFGFGKAVLVHATPWSTEDVVLPDAELPTARRMVAEARARLVVYGHIHTPYQRSVDDAFLVSVGAISGSNDADPRPAYTIATLDHRIAIEVRRVDWSRRERLHDYAAAGVAKRSFATCQANCLWRADRASAFPCGREPSTCSRCCQGRQYVVIYIVSSFPAVYGEAFQRGANGRACDGHRLR